MSGLISESEVSLVIADSKDLPACAALYNQVYARQINEAYLKWQFFNCPYQANLFVLKTNNQIVGIHGAQKRTIDWQNQVYPVIYTLDSIVAPGFRGVALYKKMIDSVNLHGMSVGTEGMYCFANKIAAPVLERLLGWTLEAEISTFTCPTKPIDNSMCRLTFTTIDKFEPWVDSVREKHIANQFKSVGRTSEYLNWRFSNHPLYQYKIFQVLMDANPVGYIVLKTYRAPDGHTTGDLVDVLLPNNYIFWKEALQFCLNYFHQQNITSLSCWLESVEPDVRSKLITEFEFEKIAGSKYFCHKDLSANLAPGPWYLTMADSEKT